ncbi:MAG TPA: hypothetical protein VJ787_02630 [Thermoleophilia bacterium]|nr:hypothetical protein [Thermoleophilia bacterium]
MVLREKKRLGYKPVVWPDTGPKPAHRPSAPRLTFSEFLQEPAVEIFAGGLEESID